MKGTAITAGIGSKSSYSFQMAYASLAKWNHTIVMLYVDDFIQYRRVADGPQSSVAEAYEDYLNRKIEHHFRKIWQGLDSEQSLVETTHVHGKMGKVLFDFVHDNRPDVLFIGCKRADLIDMLLFGGPVEKLLQLPGMALVVVTDCQGDTPINFLLSYDFSKCGQGLIEWIKSLGKTLFMDLNLSPSMNQIYAKEENPKSLV